MTTSRFIIDFPKIFDASKAQTPYAFAQRAGISLPTVYRYKNHADSMKAFDGEALYSLAMAVAKARGVSVESLTLGDIFAVQKE